MDILCHGHVGPPVSPLLHYCCLFFLTSPGLETYLLLKPVGLSRARAETNKKRVVKYCGREQSWREREEEWKDGNPPLRVLKSGFGFLNGKPVLLSGGMVSYGIPMQIQ